MNRLMLGAHTKARIIMSTTRSTLAPKSIQDPMIVHHDHVDFSGERMNPNIWCEVTEHVVNRTGIADLDPLQRERYFAHISTCLRCRSALGTRARSLGDAARLQDFAAWPHLSVETLRELASLDEPQRVALCEKTHGLALH